ILWPFFDFTDPRWTFGKRYLMLRQDPKAAGPTKIGLAHRGGWVGYLNAGTLFVKRVVFDEGKTYPDGGANIETFSDAEVLEIESLGPLTRLEPGAKVESVEEWELFADVPAVAREADVEKTIRPLAEAETLLDILSTSRLSSARRHG